MRTDAFDRFGTRLEKRFTRPEVIEMMELAGLEQIGISDRPPYWCAIGRKRSLPSRPRSMGAALQGQLIGRASLTRPVRGPS